MLPSCEIRCGDCREVLKLLPAEMAQCCVTSPPYWGLRDYGTAEWEGGEPGCEHKRPYHAFPDHSGEAYNGSTRGNQGSTTATAISYSNTCAKCGARRIDAQLGLESTPEEYINKMAVVFREVWRVLRDDGTLWVNMGDSYATSNPAGRRDSGNGTNRKFGDHEIDGSFGNSTRKQSGLKPKDLCGIPWRLAFALQADGWYLRSDIIWHKPNPMPESVTDRPTKAHEYIFLLSKQQRYFYDAEAIREPVQFDSRNEQWGKTLVTTFHDHSNDQSQGLMQKKPNGFVRMSNPAGRNKRSVWTVATQPYAEAHFATFPEDLIKPCILAGSRPGDTVLDPFGGSGTTGKVAIELGRSAILIELNPQYAALAKNRTNITPGFL
jgi:DNA modification methylase